MLNLIFEWVKLIAWLGIVIYAFIKRKGLPHEKLSLAILSALLMVYATFIDIMHGDYFDKNFIWFPANISVIATYFFVIRSHYKKWQEVSNRITRLTDCMGNLKPLCKEDKTKKDGCCKNNFGNHKKTAK